MKLKSVIQALLLAFGIVFLATPAATYAASEDAETELPEETPSTLTASAFGVIGSLVILPGLMFMFRE